jgi:hypothetical protein
MYNGFSLRTLEVRKTIEIYVYIYPVILHLFLHHMVMCNLFFNYYK